MHTRDIIVIGASAGGFEALQQLVAGLPPDLNAAIFIVWHLSPDVKGILPQVLNKKQTVSAVHALDMEPIVPRRIYVAPPNKHLILDKEVVHLTHGPKENGFRPAVDPLFRSAAYHFGARVIGIVLSGALDDGSAGLWTIKQYGGIAIVQDPLDAQVSSMPENAIRSTNVDYILPVTEMPALLQQLTAEPVEEFRHNDENGRTRIENELRIAKQDHISNDEIMQFGELTPFTCPECHGVMAAIREGDRIRYRCHTGHAFSTDTLLAAISKSIEESLWSSIRAIEESVLLLNHMGDHFAESNMPHVAARYFIKAKEAAKRNGTVRQAVLDHEYVSSNGIRREAGEKDGDQSAA